MATYQDYYELSEELAKSPSLIQQPPLYNYQVRRLYAAMMSQAAAPLPDGSPSPFTSQSPASGHARLFSIIAHVHSILGHEIDLVPDRDFVFWLRAIGAEVIEGERPVLEVEFQRSMDTLNNVVIVPLRSRIRSRVDPSLELVTSESVQFPPGALSVTTEARLNRVIDVETISPDDFTVMLNVVGGVYAARNTGRVINRGRRPETIAQAVMRVRDGLRAGTLGQDTAPPGVGYGRLVTLADAQYWARQYGALKTNVLTKDHPSIMGGNYSDLMTIAIYPPELSVFIEDQMTPMAMAGQTFACTALDSSGQRVPVSEIIPLVGSVTIAGSPEIEAMTPDDLFNLVVAEAIVPITYDDGRVAGINPPGGIWGDTDFERTLATAIEFIDGIYAVPDVSLFHRDTNQPLAEIDVNPWQLFEIQSDFQVLIERS